MSGIKRSGTSGRKVPHAGDLFALGTKPAGPKSSLRHPATDSDDSAKPLKPSTTLAAGGNPAKKFKGGVSSDNSGGLFSDPIRVSQVSQQAGSSGKQAAASKGGVHGVSPQPSGPTGTQQLIEVRSSELLSAIKAAKSAGNEVKAGKILGGALKQLRLSRLKPDTTLNSSLVTLVHDFPDLFSSPAIVELLILILKREPSVIFKARSNPSVYILAAQLLLFALKDSYDWPEVVAKVYVEDALGDRVWVDLDSCKGLVANTCTLFATKPCVPMSSGVSSSGGAGKAGEQGKTSAGGTGEGSEGFVTELSKEAVFSGIETAPRFSPSSRKALKAYILQLVNEQLGRHNMPADNVSRNLLRFLITAVGFPELRLLVAQKIDSWIQNPKLGKQCQELLLTVCVNCHTHSQEDINVIEALINIRLKTKLFSSQFVACIKELIGSHPGNFATVMRGVVNNELGQWRSPSNMALISMMIHSWPEDSAKLLGSMFQEFLTRKEDYLRALRGFLREVVRVIRNEFNFTAFVRSLMQDRSESEFSQLEPTHKERVFQALTDLICTASVLTANMLIREAYSGYNKGDRAMVGQLQEFFSTLGLIQRDAVWWVHTVVPAMFRPQPADYKACLRKLLFLEGPEAYCRDNWPPEADRSLIHKMMGELCLKEDTFMRVLVIGLTKELPLSPADAMDIADVLVARAANAHTEDIQRLPSIERKEFFSAIFDITTYRPPANIVLPEGYLPPSLAISKLYWKGWLLLLVLSAFNPKTIGAMGWSEYPMLRGMMEMVMTNNFSFPTSMNLEVSSKGVAETRDNAAIKEMQLARTEKEAILEYENHLASSSGQKVITESSSYLVNQVTMLSPKGPARKLPPSVIELIRTVNRTLKLGQLLCRCRSPDFLLSVIKKQGTLESMKWLTDLVESSHSSMEVLPVPCLCEFLLASYQDQLAGSLGSSEGDTDTTSHRSHYKRKRSNKDKALERHSQLIEQLQNLISGPKSSPQSCSEVLAYFLEKLTLSHLTPRKLAINALHDILARTAEPKSKSLSEDTDDGDFHVAAVKDGERLVSCLPSITHFAVILPQIYPFLLQACLVETNLNCLQHYMLFLAQNYPHGKLYESVIGISRLIVDRFDVIRKFLSPPRKQCEVGLYNVVLLGSLLELFRSALDAAMHSQTMAQRSSSAEFLLVTFPSVSQKTILHMTIIQAIFLLLSQDRPQGAAAADFSYLLDLWVPTQPQARPEVCTIEEKEKLPLPPKEVLHCTLLSRDVRVLEASVGAASPAALCKFVEQFGCPVISVERVLEVLDDICNKREAATELRHTLLDPATTATYVEIQMRRGIGSGQTFLTFLRGLANIPHTDLDLSGGKPLAESEYRIGRSSASGLLRHCKPAQPRTMPEPSMDKCRLHMQQLTEEEVEQQLLCIFLQTSSSPSQARSEMKRIMSILEFKVEQCLTAKCSSKASSEGDHYVGCLIPALHKLLSGSSVRRMQFLEGMVKTRFSLTLLRMIMKLNQQHQLGDHLLDIVKSTLDNICLLVESSIHKVSKLKLYLSFVTTLKSCCENFQVQFKLERKTSAEVVSATCNDIKTRRDPFENEASLIKLSCDLTQSSSLRHFEDLVGTLARRSVVLNVETKCIKILQSVRMGVGSSCVPIALQCSPAVFSRAGGQVVETVDTHIQCLPDVTGLLVDVFELLDPDMMSLSPETSMQFLFGGGDMCLKPSSVATNLLLSGQGYLLARLVNNSSWDNLLGTVSHVLDKHAVQEWVNPSAVLDFLWACLHKPCLWQEKVKKEAIVNSSISLGVDEDSELNLTLLQLETLVDHILKESVHYLGNERISLDEVDEITPEVKSLLSSRLPLLIGCCTDDQSLRSVVFYLQTNNCFPTFSWQLLVQLYHAKEKVMFMVDQPHPLTTSALDISTSSKLDSSLHNLISAMADAQPGEASHQKISNAALLCCKLTLHHPSLMLRQLPMLGWMLKGRAHLRPGEFRNRNHKLVFENVFTLLEMLQPLIFMDSQADSLNLCLEAFFDFMKNHCSESKKYQDIVSRFSEFLVQYAQQNREKAAGILYKNLDILRSLNEVYTNKKSSLKFLVECFPKVPCTSSVDSLPLMMALPAATSQGLTHEQVMPFLKKLENGQQREDILKVLQDLKETSLHSVDILKHFVPELCRIIQEPEPESCGLAHDLLMRHLKYSPSSVEDLLPAFIGCLESQDHTIIRAAVPSLPDLLLLCKGSDANYLLKMLFLLATHSSYNCTGELIKCVEAFTQHTIK